MCHKSLIQHGDNLSNTIKLSPQCYALPHNCNYVYNDFKVKEISISDVSHCSYIYFVFSAANKPPPAPVNLRLTSHLYTDQNVTVVFEWDHDTSNIVDSYSISISPTPPSQPVVNEITSAIWNATLEYSIDYVVNVTAVNCGGRSRPLTELVNYGEQSMGPSLL